jgi:hypothetical protein
MIEADRQAIDYQTVDQDACQDGDTAYVDILVGTAPPSALMSLPRCTSRTLTRQADPERGCEKHQEEEGRDDAVLDRDPNIQVVGGLRKEDLALTRTNSERRIGERGKRQGLRGEPFSIIVL